MVLKGDPVDEADAVHEADPGIGDHEAENMAAEALAAALWMSKSEAKRVVEAFCCRPDFDSPVFLKVLKETLGWAEPYVATPVSVEIAVEMRMAARLKADDKMHDAVKKINDILAMKVCSASLVPDLEAVSEKLQESRTAHEAAQAQILLSSVQARCSTEEAQKAVSKVNRDARDVVVYHVRARCSDPKNRIEFKDKIRAAYPQGIDTDLMAGLLLAYHKDKDNDENCFASNNAILTERRGGTPRPPRIGRSSKEEMAAAQQRQQQQQQPILLSKEEIFLSPILEDTEYHFLQKSDFAGDSDAKYPNDVCPQWLLAEQDEALEMPLQRSSQWQWTAVPLQGVSLMSAAMQCHSRMYYEAQQANAEPMWPSASSAMWPPVYTDMNMAYMA